MSGVASLQRGVVSESSPLLPVKRKRRKKKQKNEEDKYLRSESSSLKRKRKRKSAEPTIKSTKQKKKKRRKKITKPNDDTKEVKQESPEEGDTLEKLKNYLKTNIYDFNNHFDEIGREIGPHNYQVVALLGVGAQGRVYLVRLTETGELYAMKVFVKEQIIDNDKAVRSVLTEQRFLATTDHPFITKLLHSFQSAERLFMVMEFCPGGELWTLIKNQPQERLNEEQVRFFASEVLIVLEYVHSKGYIYRDLKPENILIHLDGHIRMADFGLSKQSDVLPEMKVIKKKDRTSFFKSRSCLDFSQGAVIKTDSLVGSVHYLAPEVLSVRGSYDVMADWWSFGVLLYDMFYGAPPFQGRCNEEIIMKISQGDFKFHEQYPISAELKSLIKGLLKLNPKKRICAKRGASDLKRHPFFRGVSWGLLRNVKPPIIPEVKHLEDLSNFELYDDEEETVDFEFFSELPEDPYLLTPQEQKNFDEFTFTRKSFAQSIVGKIEPVKEKSEVRSRSQSLQQESPKKRKRKRREKNGDGLKLQRFHSQLNERCYEKEPLSPKGAISLMDSCWPTLDDIPMETDNEYRNISTEHKYEIAEVGTPRAKMELPPDSPEMVNDINTMETTKGVAFEPKVSKRKPRRKE